MTSNLKLIDVCSKILQTFIPASGYTEEARVLHEIMDELKRDIEYVQTKLKAVGESIDKLQNEVLLVIFRHCAELTKRRRWNLTTTCRVAILLSLLSSQRSTCPLPSSQ